MQIFFVCARPHGRGGADDADPAVFRHGHGASAGGFDRTDDRNVVLLREQIERHRRDRVAGDDDGLEVELPQERNVLPRIFHDGVAAARAVGHTARITEIDDVFLRHERMQAAHCGQTAHARVEHTDRAVVRRAFIHDAPPAPERSGGRAAPDSGCPRSRTAWGTC